MMGMWWYPNDMIMQFNDSGKMEEIENEYLGDKNGIE
jgi:hypothetical protein